MPPKKDSKAAAKSKGVTKKAAKGGKKEKDPNAPKRGMSAFMFFSNAKRDSVKSENPDMKFGEIGKKLGEMWKEIDAKEKSKYEEMAQKDKARYEKEKAAYDKGGKSDKSDKKSSSKKKKEESEDEEEEEEEEDDD